MNLPDHNLVCTRRDAVRLIVQANMEQANAYGHGNRAAKRAARAEEAQLADVYAHLPADVHPSEAEVDAMAERDAEARRSRYHDLPMARNFHE